jgi:hydrogenase nickel incorporation protein HypA/HybF
MHELSVAQNIVDIIEQHVPVPDLPKVRTVHLRIGTAAGIVVDSLEFSFGVITNETALNHAALAVESVPFLIRCNTCGKESANEQGITLCSHCGSSDTTIIAGTELHIGSIELDDSASEPP